MRFENVFIPYGAYWSSPFCRWQGSLSNEHPLKLAATCAGQMLRKSNCQASSLGSIHLGMTVPQHQSFWGAPWVAAMLEATHVTGPTISQACATSARVVASAAASIELAANPDSQQPVLALAADRISNGPNIYYPNPRAPGGTGVTENWVLDNFGHDPYAKVGMIDTAENIAGKFGFSRAAQDELTLHRYSQYQSALQDDRAFQKRYLAPITLTSKRGEHVIAEDEGIIDTNREALKKLRPVRDGGTVTYAAQTHPADGNAGMLMSSRNQAKALSHKTELTIQLLAFGEGRAEKAHMGMAPVPAAQSALASAGICMADVKAVKTHNPFAVNDLYFAQQTGFDAERMNNYGSSLIFGHPQGPTGLRLIIELIEELEIAGGGYGLFTGCAAGDSGAAVVLKVS